jgi:hypothetical protein
MLQEVQALFNNKRTKLAFYMKAQVKRKVIIIIRLFQISKTII